VSAPAFTVVCATYNRGTAINDTILSVVAQTRNDWELVVVSDGSTDGTDDVVISWASQDSRIRLLRVGHHGHPGPVRNAGVAVARGRWIAYLDHDDRFRPEHLATLEPLLHRSQWAISGAARRDPGNVIIETTGPVDLVWSRDLQACGPLFEPSRVAHARTLLDTIGPWPSCRRGLEDWDLWDRFAGEGITPALGSRVTVDLHQGPSTRRHHLSNRYVFPLGVAPGQSAASKVIALLAEAAGAWSAATAVDVRDWLAAEVRAGTLVVAEGAPADIAGAAARAAATAPPPDLIVLPAHVGMTLNLPLACVRREHAARCCRILSAMTKRRRSVLQSFIAVAASKELIA
jgi:hypothetical protein